MADESVVTLRLAFRRSSRCCCCRCSSRSLMATSDERCHKFHKEATCLPPQIPLPLFFQLVDVAEPTLCRLVQIGHQEGVHLDLCQVQEPSHID